MANLFWILLIAVAATFFWQQRRQSEIAKQFIQHRCQHVDVQLISFSRGKYDFGWPKGPVCIKTQYIFEFSPNGIDCYQGHALMNGMRLQEVYMPPYPI